MSNGKAGRELLFSFLFVLIMAAAVCGHADAASQPKVEDAKNAIVEVQAGLKSYDGKFYRIKSASGFVISNDLGSVYIITSNHSVTVNESEKKKIYKKYKINKTESGLESEVRILVEGDVASDVTVKASSKNDDFCILEAGNVLNKKTSLCLSDHEELTIGDPVYLLGYPKRAEADKAYTNKEVEIHAGIVQDAAAPLKGNTYIQHSAVILAEQSGGALVNDKGYLVGMGNHAVTNSSIGAYYALPISRIQVILDNYGISYDSRKKEEEVLKLKKTYQDCQRLSESGKYKKDSMKNLEEALQNAKEIIGKDKLTSDEVHLAQSQLDQGRKKLKKKVAKKKIVKFVLIPILVICTGLTCYAGISYFKIKKRGKQPENPRPVQDKEEPDMPLFDEMPGQQEMEEKHQNGLVLPDSTVGQTVLMRQDANVSGFPDLGSKVNAGANAFHVQSACLIESSTGSRHYISKKIFYIGKNPDNDFQIVKTTISRKHAVIFWREGNYYIRDQGSVNGTYVNGRAAGEGVKLCNHDMITLAKEEMEFMIKE